jgi:hypothetical protein
VGGPRPRSREGNRVALESILNGGQSLCRSSFWQTRRHEVSPDRTAFFPCVVTGVLAQDTFKYAVADPHYLVLLFALEVVIPSFVTAPALIASRGGPLAFGRSIVVPNFVATGALDEGG